MPGIIPEVADGAIVIRDSLGNCLEPAGVENAYCPPEEFESTCDISALPSDCTARISPEQINAIVSELLCFAVALNPTGSWDCDSLCNLADNFAAWKGSINLDPVVVDNVTIIGSGTVGDPLTIFASGVVSEICGDAAAKELLVDCLISTDADNGLIQGGDGGFWVDLTAGIGEGDGVTISETSPFSVLPVGLVNSICADDPACTALASCLISDDANNAIEAGTDGRLWVDLTAITGGEGDGVTISENSPYSINPVGVVDAICVTASATDALIDCLTSEDPDNALETGLDGKMYVSTAAIGGVHVLHGTKSQFHGNELGIPAGTTLHGAVNIPIANSHTAPITVQLELSAFIRSTENADLVTASIILYDDSGGSAGGGFGIAWFSLTNEGDAKTYDMKHNAILEIPPGGRTLSVEFQTVAPVASGDTQLTNTASRVTWYGVAQSGEN